ncbi:hypothetical protein C8R44DRAFT_928953 [Mycena epipterygia]|nr:hypothetical protein C8R44DRAFT_928953 [Mycena epipterygia]
MVLSINAIINPPREHSASLKAVNAPAKFAGTYPHNSPWRVILTRATSGTHRVTYVALTPSRLILREVGEPGPRRAQTARTSGRRSAPGVRAMFSESGPFAAVIEIGRVSACGSPGRGLTTAEATATLTCNVMHTPTPFRITVYREGNYIHVVFPSVAEAQALIRAWSANTVEGYKSIKMVLESADRGPREAEPRTQNARASGSGHRSSSGSYRGGRGDAGGGGGKPASWSYKKR